MNWKNSFSSPNRPRPSRLGLALALGLALWLVLAQLAQAGGREFSLAGTCDLHGHFDSVPAVSSDGQLISGQSRGGLARLAYLIKALKNERPGQSLIVSSGDDLTDLYFLRLGGAAIYKLLLASGYELFIFGNHEFDRGPKTLAATLSQSALPCLNSDLDLAGTFLQGLCQPYVLRELGGVKVGVFSLLTESLPYISDAGGIKQTQDNIATARRMVAELKSAGAEVVVALTHVGLERDLEIAAQAPGIDLIFGGHSHLATLQPQMAGQTMVVNAGCYGQYFGRVDFSLPEPGQPGAKTLKFNLIPITQDIPEDPKVRDELNSLRASMPQKLGLGRSDSAWDLGTQELREGRSAFGAYFSDLLRQRFKTQIALVNAGGLRGGRLYPAGEVTDERLKEIFQFDNTACLAEIKGRDLMAVLERSAASYGRGGLLYASGVRYTIDLAAPAQEIIDGPAGLIEASPGERVKSAEIRNERGEWEALDPDRIYRVVGNDFMLLKGGDGYFWFKRFGAKLENSYVTFYSVLEDHLVSSSPLSIPALDERLKILNVY